LQIGGKQFCKDVRFACAFGRQTLSVKGTFYRICDLSHVMYRLSRRV